MRPPPLSGSSIELSGNGDYMAAESLHGKVYMEEAFRQTYN
jgi:hypothetical protein